MYCLDNCSNCIKDNGKDICTIAADDGIVKKIEPGDEVPDICRAYRDWETDRKSTRLNSSHSGESRMPSSA